MQKANETTSSSKSNWINLSKVNNYKNVKTNFILEFKWVSFFPFDKLIKPITNLIALLTPVFAVFHRFDKWFHAWLVIWFALIKVADLEVVCFRVLIYDSDNYKWNRNTTWNNTIRSVLEYCYRISCIDYNHLVLFFQRNLDFHFRNYCRIK